MSESNDRLGLAFSGGGIRSATFNLGVLQVLAKLRLLERFDFLSTVSGGGYIGGWLVAWIRRLDKKLDGSPKTGIRELQELLGTPGKGRRRPNAAAAEAAEPREVRFLRDYSNYLTPRRGLFTGDSWAAIASYIRNPLLNLIILTLALLSVLLAPRILLGWWHTVAAAEAASDQWWFLLFIVAVLLMTAAHVVGKNVVSLSGKQRDVNPEPEDVRLASSPPMLLYIGPPWLLPTLIGAVPLLLAYQDNDGEGFVLRALAVLAATVVLQFVRSRAWPTRARTEFKFDRAAGSIRLLVVLPILLSAWLLGPWLWSNWPEISIGVPPQRFDFAAVFGAELKWWLLLGAGGHAVLWLVLWYHAGKGNRTFWVTFLAALGAGALGGFLLRLVPPLIGVKQPPGNQPVGSDSLASVATADSTSVAAGPADLFSITALPVVILVIGVTGIVFIGLVGRDYSDEAREWWSRLVGSVATWTIAITGLSVASILGWEALKDLWTSADDAWMRGAIGSGWLLATISGLLAGKSASTAEPGKKRVAKLVAGVAPYVFVGGLILLVAGLAEAVSHWAVGWIDGGWDTVSLIGAALGSLVLAVGLSWRVDINEFSMHAVYRNRLVRAYLGASNERDPSPWTGFDPSDNDVYLNDLRVPSYSGPYPIVNTTLNLVGGKKLAWQQRRAASFAFTPDSCGFEVLPDSETEPQPHLFETGFRSIESYGGRIPLGTAMAISGAAASPNMGHQTSTAVAFLMTVFNVRLGWWMRNPRRHWHRLLRPTFGAGDAGPRLGLLYLLFELLGQTNDEQGFVYLSDGGHFENLGIYELVKRRCKYIVACDAEADPKMQFSGLGNAIEKCRTDFGVEISIDVQGLRPAENEKYSAQHWAMGTIEYPERGNERAFRGILLYIKSSLTGDEPTDVLRYKDQNPDFPHESTADQWFEESQFESYRRLGQNIAESVFETPLIADITKVRNEDLFGQLRRSWAAIRTEHQESFVAHLESLDRLHTEIRDRNIEFLDGLLHPDWTSLVSSVSDDGGRPHGEPPGAAGAQHRLPRDATEFREAFVVCNQMMRLMEGVYLDLRLDTEMHYPDNDGWMHLFRQWARGPTFRLMWMLSGRNYSVPLRAFCREHLGLDVKNSGWVKCTELRADMSALDAYERTAVRSWLSSVNNKVFVFQLVHADHPSPFAPTVGVAAIERIDGTRSQLLYFRIREQFQRMGLGHAAMRKLLDEQCLRGWAAHRPETNEERAVDRLLNAVRRTLKWERALVDATE